MSKKKNNRNQINEKRRSGESSTGKSGRYGKMPKEEVVGKVIMSREGYAFIKMESAVDDIFVPARRMRGALNGDTVRVAVLTKKRGDLRKEGEVIQILERSVRPHTGILQIVRNQAWVITEGKNMPYDIRVSVSEEQKKFNGYKVAAVIEKWNKENSEPEGRIVDILGKPGENNTEMHAILTEFGLPYKFDPEVEAATALISENITSEDVNARRDFRNVTTFTIDPADAKDFDDALSLQKLNNGNWEVGIHIADVTHYVKSGNIVDKEAYDRATSVYLADRTVPMLPEKLSTQLCSLRPREEKLTFSAVFEMNEKGKVVKKWFGKTIIMSDYRFSYEEAQAIIEEKRGPLMDEILQLHKLASLLRDDRFRNGAISFERPEMKIEVDKDGKPVNIYQKESKDSNWLIEEFMLMANREVAMLIGMKRGNARPKTFIYRIHEEPNMDKIVAFRTFLGHIGYSMKATKNAKELSSAINELLSNIKGKPEEGAVEIMALRSMARARYSTDNAGHYGLAFDYYTHFTSPIRRYPDMMVHRMLAHYLDNGKPLNKEDYEVRCKHSSEREQLAIDAERASIKYKMVEFMQDKVGNEYEGNISGLTDWGMFVELDGSKVEGMIPLREIKEDYLQFNEESYILSAKKSGRKFHLGDPVRIKVVRANLDQKQLDFALIWNNINKTATKASII